VHPARPLGQHLESVLLSNRDHREDLGNQFGIDGVVPQIGNRMREEEVVVQSNMDESQCGGVA
jgi:hypothetical protein